MSISRLYCNNFTFSHYKCNAISGIVGYMSFDSNDPINEYSSKAISKDSCFPSQRASLLMSASRKFFYFISFNLMYLSLPLIIFRWKQNHFVLYFNQNTFLADFTIWFHDRNTFLMICGKCKIIPVSKILGWPCRKNKK